VKLLVDTHLLLWAAADTLPKKAVPFFTNTDNTLFFSSASIWEVAIKHGLNRPDFSVNPAALYRGLLDNGYTELPVTANHVLLIAELPLLHKDPFDRILIAQARAKGLVLLTADETVSQYTPTLYVK